MSGTSGKGYRDPKIAINRVYTKKGDSGETGLVGGQRLVKDDPRIEAYGTVDELTAILGMARHTAEAPLASDLAGARASLDELARWLLRVQHELFNLGSILATLPADVHEKQPRVTEVDVARLERDMDRCLEDLEPLRSFVLPGGTRLEAELHLARTVCRRAERRVVTLARAGGADPINVTYLNRLSDALFVWSRWANHLVGAPETLWRPSLGESGGGATT